MREVNFSIPNANKASVCITPGLYDRRALDCTSTLPLINSLNNLVYLTTSSARIRDILTVDGGIERLICILKEGRNTKDLMEYWLWNLAFQSVVNIGVRGSEAVRTRVVEADMVPVIATILDNYIRVLDKAKEKFDSEFKRGSHHLKPTPNSSHKHQHRISEHVVPTQHGFDRMRRQAPPPIEIPSRPTPTDDSALLQSQSLPSIPLSSPPERTTFGRGHHHHHHSQDVRTPRPIRHHVRAPSAGVVPTNDTFGIRPVREADRLPSMLPGIHAELQSRPESPTTPRAPVNPDQQLHRAALGAARPLRRPSIRHQLSVSGVLGDLPTAEALLQDENGTGGPSAVEPLVDIQADMNEQGLDGDVILEVAGSPMGPERTVADAAEETFNMARSALEGAIATAAGETQRPGVEITPPGAPQVPNQSPSLAALPTVVPVPWMHNNAAHVHPRPISPIQRNPYIQLLQERSVMAGVPCPIPRDEDVLMCLQLLAYVSKYCNLRTYFQETHFVPKLRLSNAHIDALLAIDHSAVHQFRQQISYPFNNGQIPPPPAFIGSTQLGAPFAPRPQTPMVDAMIIDPPTNNEEPLEEYLQPDDVNIFPLIEKFTVRHNDGNCQYWSSIVMRNLCRKDDARGGIRQCAYYKCGKWEERTRQFAKCRRCRRTKYCSKECQKAAWVFHRHWCIAADSTSGSASAPGAHLASGGATTPHAIPPHHHHHHHHHHPPPPPPPQTGMDDLPNS